MFKKPVILTKVLQETQEVTLCNRAIQVEYEGFTYIIKIEPTILQSPKRLEIVNSFPTEMIWKRKLQESSIKLVFLHISRDINIFVRQSS